MYNHYDYIINIHMLSIKSYQYEIITYDMICILHINIYFHYISHRGYIYEIYSILFSYILIVHIYRNHDIYVHDTTIVYIFFKS